MRKKISLFILLIMAISLSMAIGITGQENAEVPFVIPCYPSDYVYNYPTSTIAPGQTISFDIPSNLCFPVKTIQIGGGLGLGKVKNSPTYGYVCSLSSDQGCCADVNNFYVVVCDNNNFDVITYDAQGRIHDTWPRNNQSCLIVFVNYNGRKATRFEVYNRGGTLTTFTPTLNYRCCYDCRKKVEPPATILYPKVDIENFAVAGGTTVIKDGKLLANLSLSPGIQQTFIQIENRGMFTQNDTRARFDGLPEGVTVSITPESQKLKAKKIGTYSATFTVEPNVPSGKYQITLVAYSEKGVFDKIAFEFIVP